MKHTVNIDVSAQIEKTIAARVTQFDKTLKRLESQATRLRLSIVDARFKLIVDGPLPKPEPEPRAAVAFTPEDLMHVRAMMNYREGLTIKQIHGPLQESLGLKSPGLKTVGACVREFVKQGAAVEKPKGKFHLVIKEGNTDG